MIIWKYDKSFEGFLTLVYECFARKSNPDKINGFTDEQPSVFPENYKVITDEERAARVWSGLQKQISEKGCDRIYRAFLSELEDMELWLLKYIFKIFESKTEFETDFGDEDVMRIFKTDLKVSKEAHRVLMFTRFQKTADEIYYASFDPKYNVLPLTTDHFKNRFADQKWIIYDIRRNFGFYYDLQKVEEMKFTNSLVDSVTGKIDKSIMDTNEVLYQDLWKSYFHSICIKERINLRLHMQMLPKRFWKRLTEKQ